MQRNSNHDVTLVDKLKPVPSKPSGERLETEFSERGSTAEEIYHESAGWRHLETSLKMLQLSIRASESFNDLASDSEFLEMLYISGAHGFICNLTFEFHYID